MPKRFIPSSYSYLWRTDLPAAIDAMAASGFAETELMAALPHIDLWGRGDELAAEIRAASQRSGLAIAGLNPPGLDVNIGSPDTSFRDWSVNTYIAIGRLASEVGARYLVVHPGRRHVLVPAPADLAREWVITAVSAIADALAPAGVRVRFENTPTGLLDTAGECVELVREIGPDRVGLVYDVANGFMVEDPSVGLRITAEHVEAIHLSDTTAARWLHDPIGTGEVDYTILAETVAELGFDGDVVLETVHPDDIGAGLTRDCSRLEAAGWVNP